MQEAGAFIPIEIDPETWFSPALSSCRNLLPKQLIAPSPLAGQGRGEGDARPIAWFAAEVRPITPLPTLSRKGERAN